MLGTVPALLPIHVKTRGGEGEHALPAPTGQARSGLVEVRERVVQLLLQGERGLNHYFVEPDRNQYQQSAGFEIHSRMYLIHHWNYPRFPRHWLDVAIFGNNEQVDPDSPSNPLAIHNGRHATGGVGV